jgi:isopentenyldiphosphate isomerase
MSGARYIHPMQPPIAVVDEDNRFLRWEDRREVHKRRLPHRTVHVLVFDSQARLVIQRRHRQKLTHAGYWDLSCSGHVEQPDYPGGPDERLDEIYESVACRELHEELGIDVPVQKLERFGPAEPLHYEWIELFTARSDGPYVMQKEEVEEVRAVPYLELEQLFAGEEPVTGTLIHFGQLALQRGWWPR